MLALVSPGVSSGGGFDTNVSPSRNTASHVAQSNADQCGRFGYGQALEEAVAREADQRTDDALVHRAGLAQPVERGIRIGRERAAA